MRLASQLTGWDIDILTEEEESERRQKEFQERTIAFQEEMNVDEVVAQLLVSEGFASLDEVAYVEIDELMVIDGFDEDTAREIQMRARENLEEKANAILATAQENGLQDSLKGFGHFSPPMLLALTEHSITSLQDFAECADWEIAGGTTEIDGKMVKDTGILERFDVSQQEAIELIMLARAECGMIEQEPEATEPEVQNT